jgi:multidrug efflux pump subunit AcrA (membrane-fusion protein)
VVRVDPRDYRIAVEQQAAAVRSAETELELEHSRKKVAEKEWERFGDKNGAAPALAVREPQLQTAQVAVKSARSGLRKAKLAVSRTGVKTPFAGYVSERNVELGQVVAPGTPVATLVGTAAYWVQVSVPVSELAWFTIPGVNGDAGSAVDVRQRRGDRVLTWKGQVLRLLGEVDPVGRMARVLVEIRDPLGQRPDGLAEARSRRRSWSARTSRWRSRPARSTTPSRSRARRCATATRCS